MVAAETNRPNWLLGPLVMGQGWAVKGFSLSLHWLTKFHRFQVCNFIRKASLWTRQTFQIGSEEGQCKLPDPFPPKGYDWLDSHFNICSLPASTKGKVRVESVRVRLGWEGGGRAPGHRCVTTLEAILSCDDTVHKEQRDQPGYCHVGSREK